MNRLVLTPKFRRGYRKFVKRDRALQAKIDAAIQQIERDVFQPQLGTHKLSGNLAGLLACSCGYDCRIVFALEKDASGGDGIILLIDIGTHDEVY
jgi:mRNA-degrading endonuclease YafQ of YafQ-DinJ toxin-antitoxin module